MYNDDILYKIYERKKYLNFTKLISTYYITSWDSGRPYDLFIVKENNDLCAVYIYTQIYNYCIIKSLQLNEIIYLYFSISM